MRELDPADCGHDDTFEVHAFGSAVPVRTLCGTCSSPRIRRFQWLRLVRAMPVPDRVFGMKPKIDVADAWETVEGPATWDHGGRFVVLETVAGELEYAVVDAETMRQVARVPLSLDKAVEVARGYEEAARDGSGAATVDRRA